MTVQEPSPTEDAKWSTASFRVWSDEMPPDALADALGLRPTKSHRKAEPVSRTAAVRKEHFICIESSLPKSAPLQDRVAALCDLLEPVASKLAAISGRCEYDLFCGFSSGNGQGGFTLGAELLSRVAALKIELVVDLYPPQAVEP